MSSSTSPGLDLLALDPDLLKYATPEERAEIEEAAAVQLALRSPLDYAERAEPGLIKPYRHTELLNEYAVALVEHRLYDDGIGPSAVWTYDDDPEEGQWLHPDTGEPAHDILVLSVSPRHGKSLLLTETLPAWYISRYPDRRVILTGYGANLARGFSKKNRDKITPADIPGVRLDRTTQAADEWGLDNGKGMVVSAGAGGTITGKGADLMVIDDPVKNQEDALSETYHQKMWDWWLSTAKSRIHKGGVVLIIQTRWHEDDLAGKVSRSERCFTVNIPALAFEGNPDPVDGVARDPETDERDPLGRRPGEALCPALQTRARLEAMRSGADESEDSAGGALWFSCLYQGKPAVRGGGTFPGPWLRYKAERGPDGVTSYTLRDKNGRESVWQSDKMIRFITADLAISTKTRADWTVFSLWGWTLGGHLLLLDMRRVRIEAPEHEAAARGFWQDMTAEHGKIRFFGIEDRTFGTSLIQAMARTGGITVRPLKADTDKETRALSSAGPMVASGTKVFFPDAPWVKDFIRECEAFPNGSHDDMVDTLSYAGLVCLTLPKSSKLRKQAEQTYDQKVIAHVTRKDTSKKRSHPILGRW